MARVSNPTRFCTYVCVGLFWSRLQRNNVYNFSLILGDDFSPKPCRDFPLKKAAQEMQYKK